METSGKYKFSLDMWGLRKRLDLQIHMHFNEELIEIERLHGFVSYKLNKKELSQIFSLIHLALFCLCLF